MFSKCGLVFKITMVFWFRVKARSLAKNLQAFLGIKLSSARWRQFIFHSWIK